MKNVGWILLAAGGYFGYRLWRQANASEHIRYSVKRVHYIGSTLGSTTLELELGILNPTDVALNFNKFIGNLRFQGATLVDVRYAGTGSPIKLNPGRETVIKIPVSISHLGAILAIKDAITALLNKSDLKGVQVNGLLYAGGFEVPINQSINLNFSKTKTEPPAVSGSENNCFTCVGLGTIN